MPESVDTVDAVDQLFEFHIDLGFQEPERFEKEDVTDSQSLVDGFWITYDLPASYVLVDSETPFATLIYEFDLVDAIANRLDEETAHRYADPLEGATDLSVKDLAALNLIDGINEQESVDIHYKLRDILSTWPAWYMIEDTNRGNLRSFEIQTRIFPHSEGFEISDYNQALATSYTLGQRARLFLEYTFNLSHASDEEFKKTMEQLQSLE